MLTGSPITDMKITLTSGRAHQKHTEGGDFRQATYRAVRQGLKKADSILLEPYYEFRMELPSENVGRAMTDIQNMSGKFGTPMIEEETTVLTGSAPVSLMRGYQKEFTAYTGGRGRMAVSLKGYDICHNQEEVLAESTYDSEADLANPTGSVFCAHGACPYTGSEEESFYRSCNCPGKREDERAGKRLPGSEVGSAPESESRNRRISSGRWL